METQNAVIEIEAKYNEKHRTKDADCEQTDADSEIYYAMHPSENRTPTMPDKTKKILILISS